MGSGWSSSAIPASPTDEAEATEAARDGAWEGTAVGMSSVALEEISGLGWEKTGPEAGGRLEEGEGALVERATAVSCPTTVESLMVLSANASISSVDD